MSTIKNWHADATAKLSRGQRAADIMRNAMGSWYFVGGFIAFMIIWAAVNLVLTGNGWDPYPFILLNLFLSMLAGLQGAILLIAAKRQDAIAAALSQSDYDTNTASMRDVELLLAMNRDQLTAIAELQVAVAALSGKPVASARLALASESRGDTPS